jgi:hypothetical protein
MRGKPAALIGMITVVAALVGAGPASGFVYWTLRSGSGIMRATLGGSGVRKVVDVRTGLGGALAVDDRYLYWADWPYIGRAELDGGQANNEYYKVPTEHASSDLPQGPGLDCCSLSLAVGRSGFFVGGLEALLKSHHSGALILKREQGHFREVARSAESFVASPDWLAVSEQTVFWSDFRLAAVDARRPQPQIEHDFLFSSDGGLAIGDGYLYEIDARSGLSTITRVPITKEAGYPAVDPLARPESVVAVHADLRLRGLAFYGGFIYWASPDGYIGRASADGKDVEPHWIAAGGDPEAVTVNADQEPRDVAVSPSTGITFPSRPIDTISPKPGETVTITSSGFLPVNIKSVKTVGVGHEDFVIGSDGCTDRQLAPGATCKVAVRFAPSAAGSLLARLEVTGDMGPDGRREVPLSGTGT